ncbi:MAG: hypothetical protein ACTHU0_21465 [Kofleriaceae bacterium]
MAGNYPRIQTVHDAERLHSTISVQYNKGDVPKVYCGDHWCHGQCGLPALVIPWRSDDASGELKCGGNQVCEYLCNPEFRAAMVDEIARINCVGDAGAEGR